MQKEKKYLWPMIVFLAILAAILCNIFAFLLPQDPIHEHVKDSAIVFTLEGAFPETIPFYSNTIGDNNTDAWMLLIADYHGDRRLLDKAFGGYYSRYTNEDSGLMGIDNLPYIVDAEPIGEGNYARYWHGWLIVLRGLLLFFDYTDIRMIATIVQFLLLTYVFILIERRKKRILLLPFAIACITLTPGTVAVSMCYSITYYITCISLIVILRWHEEIERHNVYPLFFLLIGMATAYFEFLTYPVASLGIPLVFCFVMKEDNVEKSTLRNKVLSVVGYAAMWGAGYFGMWFVKWIIGSLFTGRNIFAEAWYQIQWRLSDEALDRTQHISRVSVVLSNLAIVAHWPWFILYLVGILYSLREVRQKRKARAFSWKMQFANSAPYLLIAIIPFLWWIVFANHSIVHRHYTYRILSITILAGLTGLQQFCNVRDT